MNIDNFIKQAFQEDLGDGDHTSLACFSKSTIGTANLISKDSGVIAGIELAKKIVHLYDSSILITTYCNDGDTVKYGDLILKLKGSAQSILSIERVMLNCMQRMSGIASQTRQIVNLVKDTGVKLLDTRKTTPGFRGIEKWAVRIGGGVNHRFGLYDMVMIKDNHIDFSGGIKNAIDSVNKYLIDQNKKLKVEIEVRNNKELEEVLSHGGVDRILFDNFTPYELKKGLSKVTQEIETEASGGITKETIKDYALTGVEYISVGALTHSYTSLDMSLKVAIT